MQKWYLLSLLPLLQSYPLPATWNEVVLASFQEGCSTDFITVLFQPLAGKVREWAPYYDCYILELDLKQAYDLLCPSFTAWLLEEYVGVHPQLVAAWLKEQVRITTLVKFPGISNDSHMIFDFNSSTKQGGIDSPWCFNLVSRFLLAQVIPGWNYKNYGFILKPEDGIQGAASLSLIHI